MELKYIGSFNPLSDPSYNMQLPANPYAGFLVRYQGTSAAGQTALLTTFGTVTLTRDGDAKQYFGVDFMNQYDNLKGGYVKSTKGAAAQTEDVEIFIPLGFGNAPNVMNLITNTEGVLKIQVDSSFKTVFAAAVDTSVTVYGYIDDLTKEIYELLIEEWNVSVGGGTTYAQPPISKNVAAQYIDDSGSSILTSLSVKEDGKNKVDNIAKAVLQDQTNWMNQVESSQNMIEVNFIRNGNLAYGINTKVENKWYLSGAGSVKNTVFRINNELGKGAIASHAAVAQNLQVRNSLARSGQ